MDRRLYICVDDVLDLIAERDDGTQTCVGDVLQDLSSDVISFALDTRISAPPATLPDTVLLMQSDDYTDRILAEYYQLKIRMEKLKTMLDRLHDGKLDQSKTCNAETLALQYFTMQQYMSVLRARAEIEGIPLERG